MSEDNNDDKKKPFQRIQADLKSALDMLDTWDTAASKPKITRKSADENQLEEIRKLLGTLQDKMKDFEPDP